MLAVVAVVLASPTLQPRALRKRRQPARAPTHRAGITSTIYRSTATLEWDSNSQFGVRVQDVIEHLQERIRYFTFATGTSDAGATVGAAYTTSGYRKLITKVDVNFAASSGSDSFVVRLDELNSDNSIKAKLFTSATRPTSELGTVRNTHHFLFHNAAGDVGVPIDASIRLGVLAESPRR